MTGVTGGAQRFCASCGALIDAAATGFCVSCGAPLAVAPIPIQPASRTQPMVVAGVEQPAGGPSRMTMILVAAAAILVVVFVVQRGGVPGLPFAPAAPTALDASAFPPVSGQKIADLGAAHITTGQRGTYNSVPPTSGQHYASPAPWGIKDAQLPDEVAVHNLEHGGIVIAYAPGLPSGDVDLLRSLVRGLGTPPNRYTKIVLEPYAQLGGSEVAVTAWDWLLVHPGFDQASIIGFVRAHYEGSDAPEPKVP